MTNNEMLLSMSDIIEKKLGAGLQLLRNEVHSMKDELRSEMQDVKGELQNELWDVKSEVQEVRKDMQTMEQGIRTDMQAMEQGIRSDMQVVEQNLQTEIHLLKLCQENQILPRLNTIESCYTDTYRRYSDNADRMEAVSADVEVMKKVITEHSQRLQKLA